MNFQTFRDKLAAEDPVAVNWPGVLPGKSSAFALLFHPVFGSDRFVLSLSQPLYLAKVVVFSSEMEAKVYCQDIEDIGQVVAGKPVCLHLIGTAGGTMIPVSPNYREDIAAFLEGAATWLVYESGVVLPNV